MIVLCIKDFRRKDSLHRKPHAHNRRRKNAQDWIFYVEKINTYLQPRQHFCSTQRAEQKLCKQQYLPTAQQQQQQQASGAVSSSKHQQADVRSNLRFSTLAVQATPPQREDQSSFFFVVLSARKGPERPRSQERGGKGARACGSSSSACLRWLSCLQHHLLAAALAAPACNGFVRALVPREKASETVRNRGFARFIHTVPRRETAVALVHRQISDFLKPHGTGP